MKNRGNRTHLKVKVIEGSLVVGVYAGTACLGVIAYKLVSKAAIPVLLKTLLGRCCVVAACNIGFDLAIKADVWFRGTKFYINRTKTEEFFAKAEANGWTLVECEYTVEDWDQAA